MLPRIRHNNFIGAVELFVKSSHTKTPVSYTHLTLPTNS
ncbi:hypothetical protein ACX3VG_31545, partial [Escherichia coli]